MGSHVIFKVDWQSHHAIWIPVFPNTELIVFEMSQMCPFCSVSPCHQSFYSIWSLFFRFSFHWFKAIYDMFLKSYFGGCWSRAGDGSWQCQHQRLLSFRHFLLPIMSASLYQPSSFPHLSTAYPRTPRSCAY